MPFTSNSYLSNWASFCMWDVFFLMFYFSFVYSPTAPSHHTSKSLSISPRPPSMLPRPKRSSTVDQSPEPEGSESQPTPVTNKETLGSHLTAERFGGSVQVLLAGGVAFWMSVAAFLCLSHTHSSVTLSLAPLGSEHSTDGGSAVPWRYHVF